MQDPGLTNFDLCLSLDGQVFKPNFFQPRRELLSGNGYLWLLKPCAATAQGAQEIYLYRAEQASIKRLWWQSDHRRLIRPGASSGSDTPDSLTAGFSQVTTPMDQGMGARFYRRPGPMRDEPGWPVHDRVEANERSQAVDLDTDRTSSRRRARASMSGSANPVGGADEVSAAYFYNEFSNLIDFAEGPPPRLVNRSR